MLKGILQAAKEKPNDFVIKSLKDFAVKSAGAIKRAVEGHVAKDHVFDPLYNYKQAKLEEGRSNNYGSFLNVLNIVC